MGATTYRVTHGNNPPVNQTLEGAARLVARCVVRDGVRDFQVAYREALQIISQQGWFTRMNDDHTTIQVTKNTS